MSFARAGNSELPSVNRGHPKPETALSGREAALFGRSRPVLVGVEQTVAGERALWWAAKQARLHRLPLRMVHVYGGQPTAGIGPRRAPVREYPWVDAAEAARRCVERLTAKVEMWMPAVSVDGAAIEGDPVEVLSAESADAAIIVVGSRQLHAYGSFCLGRVGQSVAALSRCPVVVTRGPDTEPADGARVIAGMAPGVDSTEVLEFAFEAASRRGVPLEAVACWTLNPNPERLGGDLLMHMMGLGGEFVTDERSRLRDALALALADWREHYPDVPVVSRVLADRPVPGLVAQATGQHLLVVGTTGQRAVPGSLLGSVSQAVLQHSPCPVAVVRVRRQTENHGSARTAGPFRLRHPGGLGSDPGRRLAP